MILLDGTGQGVVHHQDGDHDHNVIENLVPAHRSCHGKHHHRDRQFTEAHRRKISETLKARGIQPPKIDRMGMGKGVPKSEAHRAAIAEGQRRRWARQREEA